MGLDARDASRAIRERQLWLWDYPKPLKERLGEGFFRSIPRAPGVYLMRDEAGAVLYVGYSGCLRQRLNQYKNAHPDRDSRKTLRLVWATCRVSWMACSDAQTARVLEIRLIQRYRPRFNRVHVWPDAYGYLGYRLGRAGIEIGDFRRPTEAHACFGAFKGGRLMVVGALRGLLLLHFAGSVPKAGAAHAWFRWELSGKRFVLRWRDLGGRRQWEPVLRLLSDYLAGCSHDLLDCLLESCCRCSGMTDEVEVAARIEALAVVERFFDVGPRRLREARRALGDRRLWVPTGELDELLVRASSLSELG